MPGRLGQLLSSGVQRIARRYQLLADLSRPLLDKGIAIGGRRSELVLGFTEGIAVEILGPENFEALICGGQQVEAAAELAGRQAGPHSFDLPRGLTPALVMGDVVLQLAQRRPAFR